VFKLLVRLVGVLTGICVVSAVLLTLVREGTKEQIEYQQLKALMAPAVKVVLPPSDNDPIADRVKIIIGKGKKGREITVFPAKKGGKLFALAYTASANGHGGPVEVMVGITVEGKIVGVKVVKHAETPGIGTKVINSKEFMSQFIGKSWNSKIALSNAGGDIQAVSGATETSTAVTNAIANAMKLFPDIKQKLSSKLG